MRTYTVAFTNVTVAAVQDLLSITTGAKAIRVHMIQLGQITGTNVANLRLSLKRLTGTLAAGTGGAAASIVPLNPGDAAAVVTSRANDTAQASGTSALLVSDVYNTVNGFLYLPPPEDRPTVGPSSIFVLSLDTAPSPSMSMSGTIHFEELF